MSTSINFFFEKYFFIVYFERERNKMNGVDFVDNDKNFMSNKISTSCWRRVTIYNFDKILSMHNGLRVNFL